ncbi:hypothetical protein A5780_19275 [Nocardia sp. 852002-20019_SCH5090214]|uniref:hypothetical protein n=1 Tax=Nocardia sp. 852002-20019_SCH5090214 TaxID=1834087 RepID=UPI0007E94CF5|nr:hypothetical protein [Nocardia sp. 852002-20019_SCH5090214]OBA62201.1 hypothetical protein A5780_19275 [Nocardia sp. 852002-20019_SCH5090214]
MRLRILELPAETVGTFSTTPFCLILDNVTPDDDASIEAQQDNLKAATGARGVLAFANSVELPGDPEPASNDNTVKAEGFGVKVDGYDPKAIAQAVERRQRRRTLSRLNAQMCEPATGDTYTFNPNGLR